MNYVKTQTMRTWETAMKRDYLILTNNPLVVKVLSRFYKIQFEETATYRDILVKARDMVYAGHELFTHPLSGSVKPNETPYRSVVVSQSPREFNEEFADIIANAITVFDKFKPIGWELNERILKDFQLIDYTLLSGAINFDAEAGLSNKRN